MMICNVRNIKLALFHSSTYTSFFNRITGHNGALSLSCFLQITLKQCFRRSSGLNGFSVPFYYFRLKNSILDIIKNEFCSYCLFAYSPGLSDQQDRVLAFFWGDALIFSRHIFKNPERTRANVLYKKLKLSIVLLTPNFGRASAGCLSQRVTSH